MNKTLHTAVQAAAEIGCTSSKIWRLAGDLSLGVRDTKGRLLGLTRADIELLRPLAERDRRGWTPEEAAEMGRLAAKVRWGDRQAS